MNYNGGFGFFFFLRKKFEFHSIINYSCTWLYLNESKNQSNNTDEAKRAQEALGLDAKFYSWP